MLLLHASTSADDDDDDGGGVYRTATMVRHRERATAIVVGTETDWHWLVTSHKYCQIIWKRQQSHRTRKNDREESVRWVWWRSSRDWRKVHVVTSSAFASADCAVSRVPYILRTSLSAISIEPSLPRQALSLLSTSPSNSQLSLTFLLLSLEGILAVIFSVLIQVLHTSSSGNHNSQLSFKLYLKKHILCSNYQ